MTIYRTLTKGLVLSSLLVFSACSDDSGSTNSNNASTNNASENNNTQGSEEKTSFDVEVKDEASGMTTKEENEIDNKDASQATSGAAIAGPVLSIYLVAPSGSTITATVETTESVRAPGSFSVSEPPEGTFVNWLAPASGQVYNSSTGSITLNGCPKAMGDKVTGSFVNVELVSEVDGSTQIINGDFDVALYAVSGALLCDEGSSGNNTTTPDENNNSGGTCDADICEDGGTCCPYAQCIFNCEVQCITQDPACNNPLTADPVKCAECGNACLDSCNVSDECRTEINALATCEANAGCDDIDDEDESTACSEANCCAELKATW